MKENRILRSINFALSRRLNAVLEAQEIKSNFEEKFLGY